MQRNKRINLEAFGYASHADITSNSKKTILTIPKVPRYPYNYIYYKFQYKITEMWGFVYFMGLFWFQRGCRIRAHPLILSYNNYAPYNQKDPSWRKIRVQY